MSLDSYRFKLEIKYRNDTVRMYRLEEVRPPMLYEVNVQLTGLPLKSLFEPFMPPSLTLLCCSSILPPLCYLCAFVCALTGLQNSDVETLAK